jgi:hypothetical protein
VADQQETGIQLTEAPLEARKNYAVWRTDYYICTGIAYAKSVGKTAEDFASFVGSKHSMGGSDEQEFAPVVQLLHFVIGNYQDGHLEVVTHSEGTVTMRCNRPYRAYFRDGPVLGVTLDEFEAYLWQHVTIMLERVGFAFAYGIEGEGISLHLSRKGQ